MTEGSNMTVGWHVGRQDGTSEWKGGPYTWEELVAFAREGRLQADDYIWHETMAAWVPAATIAGLFPEPVAPVPTSATAGSAAPAAAVPGAPPARKKRGALIAVLVVLAIVVLGGGLAAWLVLGKGGNPLAGGGPSLGEATSSVPDRAKLVQTSEWGEVPANQLAVVMVDGASRKDAAKTAKTLGGTIVGEVAYVNLYQVEFNGTTEADLVAAVNTAEADAKVDYAYPLTQVYSDAEIWGVRQSPYNDPVYDGGGGDGYKAVGVDKAWTYIKGAGIDLNDVKVGVVDDGLYMPGEGAENEFEGSVNVEFPDKDAGELANAGAHSDGSKNDAGSHGTAVSTIIGGNPDNGGPSGVAGPLGKKLTISMINQFGGKYGDTTTTPDPNDPTKQVWYDGKSYSIGSLVAITKQIENGAKVINCSWGNSNADAKDVETYKRFFTQMAADHPDVLFVCSGGNGGADMDGSKRYPSGLPLDNMITVGALDKDGKTASYADKATANYEITLGAPGTGSVVGIKGAGGAEEQDGSSFSAPHVTAAAAILKSLNPKLNAGDIKRILVATARTSVPNLNDPKAPDQAIAANMGGKILAVDEAVLKVINDLRAQKKLPPLKAEDLEKLGVVDAVAITGEAGQYQVKGIVEAVGQKGADLKIEVFGENSAIGGKTQQSLGAAGEVEWGVTLPEDKGTIVVTRLENGAKSVITIESIDINGSWKGTFTVTNVTITDQKAAEKEGCSAAIMDALKGKALPMTLDVTVDESGQGSGVMLIDMSSLSEDGSTSSEPQTIGISYSGSTITFSPQGEGVSSMTASVSRTGDNYVMNGTLSGGGSGWTMKAVFKLTKPAPAD